MSMMYECDMEEEVCVSPPQSEEDIADKMVHFKGTVKQLNSLARCLVCTKCNKLPKDKVWTLGCCLAKYCKACADKIMGSACLCCGQIGYPKDKQPDIFSSGILAEIPAVFMTIMRLEELGWDKKNAEDEDDDGEVDKKKVDEVLDSTDTKNGEEEHVVSKEIEKTPDPYEFVDMEQQEVQGTPQDQVMTSQDFPEVLEETPQNKVVGRVRASLSSRQSAKKQKKAVARSLKLPTQKKENTEEKEVAKEKTPPLPPPESPAKDDQSDLFIEELFQSSPVPLPAPVNDKTSPVELPILTPYGNTIATKNKQKVITDTPLKGEDEGPRKSRSSRSTRGSNRFRSPGEEEPPALTPYKKEIDKDDDDDDFKNSAKKRTTRSRSRKSSVSSTDSRKSARGRKVQQKDPPKTKASLLVSKGKSPDYNPRVVVEDIYKRSFSSSSTDRKRRVSSTSVASNFSNVSVSTTPVSKEKRNQKGETQLHVACRVGQLERVKALVESGVDVNAKDFAGWTAIHEVINGKGAPEDKADILRIICEKGADVNAFGGQNEETPLYFAVQMGGESLVEILLEFGASPNIRCKNGQLPKDLAYNDVILKLLEEKTGISTTSTSPNVSINLNNSALSEDHALMQTMLRKAVVFFNYDESEDVVNATKTKLNLKVANKLGPDVTHVIHKLSGKKEKSSSCVHISMNFLYAMANCMWQVSSGWIEESLKNDSCVVPCSYEILGCLDNKRNDTDEAVPGIARTNKETGNPGLLDGFCFYLYKTCGYTSASGSLKLNKKNLIELITAAGGNVSNREPNPATVDPLEAPTRFHVLNNVRGSDDSSGYDVEKLTLTTHIYLYEDGSPPPTAKLYDMEHVKSLKSDWLIDSLAQFRLLDPSNYL